MSSTLINSVDVMELSAFNTLVKGVTPLQNQRNIIFNNSDFEVDHSIDGTVKLSVLIFYRVVVESKM